VCDFYTKRNEKHVICDNCAEQGDTKHDLMLFTLAALLSSTLVYNSRGTIDQQAVERLRSVSVAVILLVAVLLCGVRPSVCLSVCLSHSCIVLKQVNIFSDFFYRRVATPF